MQNVDETSLKRVTELANQQIEAEDAVSKAETDLAQKKEALRRIQEDLLPDLMTEIGMTSFKLENGRQVTIKDGIAASISKKNQAPAFSWLRDHNLGDIIKNEIIITFGRGEVDRANKMYQNVIEAGLPCARKASVHHNTLKSVLTEQLEKGVDIPFDLFGIHEWEKSIVK